MNLDPLLLAELSRLFSAEAFETDSLGNEDEADRLWDIAAELQTRSGMRTHGETFVR